MNKSMLNLGPFNECVDMVNIGCDAKYDLLEGEIFCYSDEGLILQGDSLTKSDCIIVPMFILGLAFDKDTEYNRKRLKGLIEIRILTMLFDMANKFDITLELDNINIPIKSIDFEFDTHGRLCIRAILGIMISEKKMIQLPI